jgi:regulator of cell morphogenesis and NO signaling
VHQRKTPWCNFKNLKVERNLINANDRLGEVISRNIDLLPVVERFGIISGIGQSTIGEICKSHGVDAGFFLAVLNTYHNHDYFPAVESIDLSLLTDFLTKTHLYHKKVTIPLLQELMQELKGKLPDTRLVTTLEKYLDLYIGNLMDHIAFEEKHIFPLADLLTRSGSERKSNVSSRQLKKLFGQHANVETEISDLILIIISHIPAGADVQLFHSILHTLSHFEREQVDHARFEDKILVPRLLELVRDKTSGNGG